MATAFELKEKGNQLFKQSDFNGAEELFSQACASSAPLSYQNATC